MKKSKKKKQEIITKDIRKEIKVNMFTYGMSPYNAAVVAGLTHEAALALQNKETFKVIFKNGIDDLAERNYASIYSRMKRLSAKAGLRPDEEGCKKTVSAGESFVDVDDNGAQIECIKELNRMTRTTSSAGDPDPEKEDTVVNIRIVLANNEGTKPSEKSFMGIGSNPTRSWTGKKEQKDGY
jgi:hypothetical protein